MLAHTEGNKLAMVGESQKVRRSRIRSATRAHESESPVIVNQNVTGEYVPGPCTPAPPSHRQEWAAKEVGSLTFQEEDAHHFVVHDWGEVVAHKGSPREPGAGSPPYTKILAMSVHTDWWFRFS